MDVYDELIGHIIILGVKDLRSSIQGNAILTRINARGVRRQTLYGIGDTVHGEGISRKALDTVFFAVIRTCTTLGVHINLVQRMVWILSAVGNGQGAVFRGNVVVIGIGARIQRIGKRILRAAGQSL